MEEKIQKISSFTGLKTWQKGHKLVLNIYKISKTFPTEEQFGLTSQLRRAAVSITSNIAEGFSRKGPKDKARFYYTSLGSLTEIQNQLLIARDLNYCSRNEFATIAAETIELSKMINGLIKSVSSLIP